MHIVLYIYNIYLYVYITNIEIYVIGYDVMSLMSVDFNVKCMHPASFKIYSV